MLLQQLSWQQKLLQLPWRLLQPLAHQGGDDTTGRGAAGLVLLVGVVGAGVLHSCYLFRIFLSEGNVYNVSKI